MPLQYELIFSAFIQRNGKKNVHIFNMHMLHICMYINIYAYVCIYTYVYMKLLYKISEILISFFSKWTHSLLGIFTVIIAHTTHTHT